MWFHLKNAEEVATPALLVFPDRVQENISRMLLPVGSPARLCPHVKTHKTREILRFFLVAGVKQFKCSTIAEMEMVAMEDADFALLAVQPVGPTAKRLAELAAKYSHVEFASVVDNLDSLHAITNAAEQRDVEITVFLDIDNGMGRTGIQCGDDAKHLYRQISNCSKLVRGGLHVYDGHIHDHNPTIRKTNVDQAMESVVQFRDELMGGGAEV